MARSMWRGAIQFGLVTIPIKLYVATESKGISFNMLHESCLNRIQMKTYCPFHEETISRGDTVKGFEYARDRYVVVTDEDLASVPLKTVRAVEIEKFVRADENRATLQFSKQAYYVEPEQIGRKAFALLRSVLADSGLTAICKIVLRDREQLAALDPVGDTLLLNTLYWPDEIRSTAELSLSDGEIEFKPAERAMAEQLVAAMTGEFDAAEYHDDYREALMAVIEAKVAGQEVAAPVALEPEGNLVDLMAALEASVAAARGAKAAAPVGEVTRARPKKAAAKQVTEVEAAEVQEAEEAAPVRRRKSA